MASEKKFERKLFALYKDGGELDFPDEDWLMQVMPELKALETETLDTLFHQADQHARYERAARELVLQERARCAEEHQREMQELRVQLEGDSVRKTVGVEMRLKALDEQSKEEQAELKEEAQAKISELEETIEELEGKLAEALDKVEATEEACKEEIESMNDKCEAMMQALDDAQKETDLKRETNQKLKEEIIGNDHLTVANLNRIKFLEHENEKVKQHMEALDTENDELREEMQKLREEMQMQAVEKENGATESELKELKGLLAEREAQLISMSHRLAEASGERGGVLTPNGGLTRRDSLMERIGFGNLKTSVV